MITSTVRSNSSDYVTIFAEPSVTIKDLGVITDSSLLIEAHGDKITSIPLFPPLRNIAQTDKRYDFACCRKSSSCFYDVDAVMPRCKLL